MQFGGITSGEYISEPISRGVFQIRTIYKTSTSLIIYNQTSFNIICFLLLFRNSHGSISAETSLYTKTINAHTNSSFDSESINVSRKALLIFWVQ